MDMQNGTGAEAQTGAQETGAQENFEQLFDFDADGLTGDDGAQQTDENPQAGENTDADQQTAAAAAQGEQGTQETQEPAQQSQTEPELTLKFYGQEIKLPQSQVVTLAQKGMNYDKLVQERDALKNSREMSILQRYAEAAGMEMPDYLDAMERQLEAQSIREQTDAGMSEQQAREVVRLRQEQRQLKAAQKQQAEAQAQVARWSALLAEHPELTPQTCPPEVLQRVSSGEDPVSAYRAWEIADLRSKLAARDAADKAAQAAEKNKQTAAGSAAGIGGDEKKDKFLAGFESSFER